ncbi:MAG: outer membrane beta-barrel protein [Bacteroidota bacterium]
MKKLFAFAFSLLLAMTVVAQDEQKSSSGDSPSMWIGGEVTFGNMSARDFTIGPSFGIMLNDQMGVGGTVTFSSGGNSNAWNLEPYFRYYIPIVDQFSFYGDGFIGIGGGDTNTGIDGGEYSTMDFGARVGLQYWFTPRWSVAASSNVLVYNSQDGNGDFGAGLDFSAVNFSFFFHF